MAVPSRVMGSASDCGTRRLWGGRSGTPDRLMGSIPANVDGRDSGNAKRCRSHYTAQTRNRRCAAIIIHGGRVLRPGTFASEPLDVIVEGDTIAHLAAPASVRSEAAQHIDASGKLLIP